MPVQCSAQIASAWLTWPSYRHHSTWRHLSLKSGVLQGVPSTSQMVPTLTIISIGLPWSCLPWHRSIWYAPCSTLLPRGLVFTHQVILENSTPIISLTCSKLSSYTFPSLLGETKTKHDSYHSLQCLALWKPWLPPWACQLPKLKFSNFGWFIASLMCQICSCLNFEKLHY